MGRLIDKANRNNSSKLPIESEKLLERKLREKVAKVGGWSIKLLSTHLTGLPDRLCLFPGGKIVFVEVKTTGQKTRKIQQKVHEKLRGLGFVVEVISKSKHIDDLIMGEVLWECQTCGDDISNLGFCPKCDTDAMYK